MDAWLYNRFGYVTVFKGIKKEVDRYWIFGWFFSGSGSTIWFFGYGPIDIVYQSTSETKLQL
jgi:hypothetical protein